MMPQQLYYYSPLLGDSWWRRKITIPIVNAKNEIVRFPGDTLTTINNAATQFVDYSFNAINTGIDIGFNAINETVEGAGDIIIGATGLGLGVASTILGAQTGPPLPPPNTQQGSGIGFGSLLQNPLVLIALAGGAFLLLRNNGNR
jgi:hypothetical protein